LFNSLATTKIYTRSLHDALPISGAEILNDRVRRLISKGKCGGKEWLDVMRAAHRLNLPTSATMMFGHVETIEERFEHLVWIREVDRKSTRLNSSHQIISYAVFCL